jgi:hypothetical protein
MTATPTPPKFPAATFAIGETPAYWTHGVDVFPGPVAQFRMAQLIDLDDRLYENARTVYRFLIGWYHEDYGDALLSMRHVSKVMRQRAPAGARVLSHSVVARAIVSLLETGWVARTFRGRGKGKGASRYVPVINVLDLASQGKFPEPSHSGGTVEELSRANGTDLSRAIGTVDDELSRANGTKTRLPDPATEPGTGISKGVSANSAAPGLKAAPADAGFERVWRAYGKLGNKAASRRAFAAILNPDIAHIAARASAWAASAKAGQKRMPLEKWLTAEKYDEADRRAPTVPRQNCSSVRRDVTVVRIAPTEIGADLHVAFNDCETGDAPSAVLPMSMAELMSLETTVGLKGRQVHGVRVFMDMDEHDYLSFGPWGEDQVAA